jgi:RNA-directed DNA polymerase
MRDASTSIHMLPKLLEVADRVKRYPQGKTLALAHLLDPEMLQAGYRRIRKGAAVGVDGVDKEQYGQDLDRKILDLHEQLRTGRYRHQPIRRVHIPKAPGKTRPIGISTVQDKVVQNALSAVLQAVYEPVFSTCSYGFRPGRRAHDAIAALNAAAMGGRTRWVLEADIQTFFGAPGKARRFQRVKFPPRQGEEPPHRELSLAFMEVTTWTKRRQSETQAVTQVK